jgi:hypothetical protein
VTTEAARTGSRSLKLVGRPADYAWVDLNVDHAGGVWIPCTPGDVYYIEFWYRGVASNPLPHNGHLFIQLDIERTGGLGGVGAGLYGAATTNSTTWAKMSGYVTIPASAYRFNVRAYLGYDTPSSVVYYMDDIIIREVSEGNVAKVNAAGAQSTANTAVTNAATAQGAAVTADGKAVAADGKAVTAQGTANTASANLAVAVSRSDSILYSGPNLFQDASFENTSFWNPARSTDVARTGTRSAKFSPTGETGAPILGNSTSPSAWIKASPGDCFYLEIWVRAGDSNTQDTGHSGGIVAWFRNGAGTYLGPGWAVQATARTAHKGTWTKFSAYITAPAETVEFSCYLQFDGLQSGQVYYVDDIVLREVTEGNVAKANAGAAQATANTGVTNAAVADGKAATAQAGASAAQSQAVGAQATATAAYDNAATADGKAVVAQGLTATAQRAGSNLLSNFGFENTSFANASQFSTEQAYSGTRSWKWTVTGDNWISPFHATTTSFVHFPASPGDSYYYEMWVFPHSNNATVNTGASFYPYIAFNNAANTAQVSAAGVWVDTRPLVKGQWNKISGYLTAGGVSTIAQGVLVLHWTSAETGNVYYVDNASLYRITEATVADGKAVAAHAAANTGVANAATAQGAANTADGKAVTAQGTANTATTTARSIAPTAETDNDTAQRP